MSNRIILNVVPALPGFHAVMPQKRSPNGDVTGLSYNPIVAWVVETELDKTTGQYAGALAYPVTIDSTDLSQPVIKTPEGETIFVEHTTVDDEAEAIAEFNRLRGKP